MLGSGEGRRERDLVDGDRTEGAWEGVASGLWHQKLQRGLPDPKSPRA